MAKKPAMLGDIAQVNIRPDVLDGHNKNMSIPTLWEKSYLCPCRIKETRQPDPSCPICRGRGIAYLPPEPLNVVIQSQEKGVYNGDLGILDSGTAIGTPQRQTKVSFRDRITVKPAKVSQSFIFSVTARHIKRGFYMVYDVNEIEMAITMEGEIEEGKDYTVDWENNLFFPKPRLKDKNVSLNILTTLRYMVSDLLKENRYAKQLDGTYEQSPQKLLLKREDIFVESESFETGITDDEDVGEMIDTKRKPSNDGLNGFFRSGGM